MLDIIDHIDHHFTENIRLSDIAAQFGLSSFHLTRVFKKRTGLPLIHYVIAKRLELAKELLARMSVTEACFEVGFENLSHFSRVFKKRYGVKPSDHKKALSQHGRGALHFADGELNRRCLGQQVTSFFEQYFCRILGILGEIQARETNQVLEVAERCARGLEKDYKLWTISYESGGCRVEEVERRCRGGAGLKMRSVWHPIRKAYDPRRQRLTIDLPKLGCLRRVREGDILIADFLFPEIKNLIDAGIEFIGLSPLFFGDGPVPMTRRGPSGDNRRRDQWPGLAVRTFSPRRMGSLVFRSSR